MYSSAAMSSSPNFGRNTSFDNIKAILIFLVVFGHFVELHIAQDAFLRPIWIFAYAFHMPMFAFVSGIFSRANLEEKQSAQLIRNILAPLLGFELIYEATEYLIRGSFSVYAGLIAPYWMLWYLVSLLCWRLLLPLFARLQFPVVLSLALALVTSYSEHLGYLLSGARTLFFFPFFILGWKLGADFFASKGRDWRLICIALLVTIAGSITSFLLPAQFDYRWLYGSFSLHRLEMANLSGSMYQLLQYGVSTLLGLSILYLLSLRDWGLARVGQRSMYVFLWHGMALIALHQLGILNRIFQMGDTARLLVSLASSAAIVYLGSHSYCEKLTQKCILSPLNWLLVRQTRAPVQTPEIAAPQVEDAPFTQK